MVHETQSRSQQQATEGRFRIDEAGACALSYPCARTPGCHLAWLVGHEREDGRCCVVDRGRVIGLGSGGVSRACRLPNAIRSTCPGGQNLVSHSGFPASSAASPPSTTPGWSLGVVYYHTVVAHIPAPLPPLGKSRSAAWRGPLPGISSLNANLNSRGDLVFLSPTYTFATPILGGQFSAGIREYSAGSTRASRGR